MLILLVLCTFLQTLRGAFLPPHADSSFDAVDMLSFVAREAPVVLNDGNQQLRTVEDIMKSCLFTIIACVWTSAHPNINGPRDSGWACLKRKISTMIAALMMPDLVLYWALKQHLAAKDIAAKYNKEFARTGETERPFWKKILSWFQPLPRDTTRRSNSQSWTKTHGFFIQMGGFILYKNEYPLEVLDYNRLAELLRERLIDIPIVTELDIQDRSKGDAVSKSIVVLQTTWFVLQCVVRAAHHLPLSELEVLTLAFAVLNVATYAAWWNKPQGVGTVICVLLKSAEEEQQSHDKLEHNTTTGGWRGILYRIFPLLRPVNHPIVRFFGCILLLIYPLALSYKILETIITSFMRLMTRQWEKLTGSIPDAEIKRDALRVPMFHVAKVNSLGAAIVSCIIGTIFGAVHLLAWNSEFSLENRGLWRFSSTILTVAPVAAMIIAMILKYQDDPKLLDIVPILWILVILVTRISLIFLTLFYVNAWLIAIIVALSTIRHPPQDVLIDVSWTSHIPHFGYK